MWIFQETERLVCVLDLGRCLKAYLVPWIRYFFKRFQLCLNIAETWNTFKWWVNSLYVKVAEGVSTAGAVIALAQKYNVKLPVLTAVARIIDNELTPKKAVYELMSLPQVIFWLSLARKAKCRFFVFSW